jgi:hypothetical protein
VINGFTASDFTTRVRIDICARRFLIGNLSDLKLIAQSAIDEYQHRNQTPKK